MRAQKGQALIEMIVVLMAVLMLLWAMVWLQRWQQIKLQTQHHASLQAFRLSHSYELKSEALTHMPNYLQGLYSPLAHDQSASYSQLGAMPNQADFMTKATQDGLLGETQRWQVRSSAQATSAQTMPWSQQKFEFLPAMQVQSQNSIWVGAGHAHHDIDAVQRLKQSPSLWASAQQASQLAIQPLGTLLKAVDVGWGRATPSTNWLQPWQESVPELYLP